MKTIHPAGERGLMPCEAEKTSLIADTYGGRIHVEWDEQGKVTALGQLPFFVDFLKTGDLFEPWVKDCSLTYASPNAPTKTEVLGMKRVVSEDSAPRAFQGAEERACEEWLQTHLRRGYEALLYEP